MSGDHETPIKTPKQLITVIVLSFVIPIALIVLLVSYVTGGKTVDGQGMALKPESIAERIHPVAAVNLKSADGPRVFLTGEQVYGQVCKACHETGAANAPKFGDKDAWAPRLKQSYEEIMKNVTNGVKAMPARGGNPDLSDYELARTVVYMTSAAGGNFKEPAAPAPAAAPAAEAPAPAAAPAAAGVAAGK
jgi:cytochrome c5